MPTEHNKSSEQIFAEGLWQKRLLEGELSPAEYAARVVAEPVRYRRASARAYRWRRNSGVRRPLVRARVLLAVAALAAILAVMAIQVTGATSLAILPSLTAAALVLLAIALIAKSSAAQEIWLLNHDLREQRGQLDAFKTYSVHLQRCWDPLGKEVGEGAITAHLFRERLQQTRSTIEDMRHDEVALAILRKEAGQYLLAYSSFRPDSQLGRELEATASASDLLQSVSTDIFSYFTSFGFAGAAHELVAFSADPFSMAERWLLDQLGAYCATVGTLARHQLSENL